MVYNDNCLFFTIVYFGVTLYKIFTNKLRI